MSNSIILRCGKDEVFAYLVDNVVSAVMPVNSHREKDDEGNWRVVVDCQALKADRIKKVVAYAVSVIMTK